MKVGQVGVGGAVLSIGQPMTSARKYGLIYFNCKRFQSYKITLTLLSDYLNSGGDVCGL